MKKIGTEYDGDVKTDFHYDETGDKLVVNRVQDVETILEANKKQYNEAPEFGRYKGDKFYHQARIPLMVVEQWMREGINVLNPSPEDKLKIKRKLNSNEYRYLRTMPGKM